MTTADDVLNELQGLGIEFQPDGDSLWVRPQGRLTPELLLRLRDHKTELLALLQTDNTVYAHETRPDAETGGVVLPAVPQDGDLAGWSEFTTPDGRHGWQREDVADERIIDIPTPCPTCKGIVFWWDVTGGRHCEACTPPNPSAADFRRRAAAARERHRAAPERTVCPRTRADVAT
jgi:hypothetical protein